MKNLKYYKDFEINNSTRINEGVIIRGLLKTLSFFFTTISNIKQFFTDKDYSSYKNSYIISDLLDFMLTLKKNPDLIEFYEGNYFDIYEETHGRTFLDDINHIKKVLDDDIRKIYNKGNNINSEIDPFGEENWNDNISPRNKMRIAKIRKMSHDIGEFEKYVRDL